MFTCVCVHVAFSPNCCDDDVILSKMAPPPGGSTLSPIRRSGWLALRDGHALCPAPPQTLTRAEQIVIRNNHTFLFSSSIGLNILTRANYRRPHGGRSPTLLCVRTYSMLCMCVTVCKLVLVERVHVTLLALALAVAFVSACKNVLYVRLR